VTANATSIGACADNPCIVEFATVSMADPSTSETTPTTTLSVKTTDGLPTTTVLVVSTTSTGDSTTDIDSTGTTADTEPSETDMYILIGIIVGTSALVIIVIVSVVLCRKEKDAGRKHSRFVLHQSM
jgi:hypothetical protein